MKWNCWRQKRMKFRHNKKRNTAFLFEALVKELTKSIVKNDLQTKEKIISLIKENFKKGGFVDKPLGACGK